MFHLTDEIELGDKKYYVSTKNTHDNGWETMIFEIKKDEDGNDFIDWGGVYTKNYRAEAIEHHKEVINNIEKYINMESEKNE